MPALIGAAVLLLIWILTQWAERRRDERQHRGESVAGVVKATVGLVQPMSEETFEDKKRRYWAFCQTLSNSLVVFAAREIPKHRDVAEWTLRVAESIQSCAPDYRDAVDTAALKEVSKDIDGICAILAQELTTWLADGKDGRFKKLEPIDPVVEGQTV